MTLTELAVPERAPGAGTSVQALLERLSATSAERPIVLSLYLRLSLQDRIRNRYRTTVRNAVRQVAELVDQPGTPHAEREALHRDLNRLMQYAENPAGLPHTPGVAIFACEALELFEVLPLPRVVQSRLLIGPRPRLAEALAAVESFGRVLVAAVDRGHARFFEVTGFEVEELPSLVGPRTHGGRFHGEPDDAPGWGEHDFHNRIREERHRHFAGVARQIGELMAERPWQGLVLAGPARSLAEQEHFLTKPIAERLLGNARLIPGTATPADIRRVVLDVRARWERRQEAGLVAELAEGVGTGWAVVGPHATLRALARGQVRLLLVSAGQSGPGFRCSRSGRLVVAKAACKGEGDPLPVPDLVSEVLEEAWCQHVQVEVIEDPEAREILDGLAALLRFR